MAKFTFKALSEKFNKAAVAAHSNIEELALKISDGASKFLTPIDEVQITGDASFTMLVKREDQTPVHSFKLRGAFNALKQLLANNPDQKNVITASAGNHAQGLAYAARELDCFATIVMPTGTPEIKKAKTKKYGGDNVVTKFEGSNYDAASKWAHEKAEETGAAYIHAFNDIDVMAGQATIAYEILEQCKDDMPDYIFVPVGGGGLAAGLSTIIKKTCPDVKIIGVEQEGQASMKAALDDGKPIPLEELDPFADGTAVRLAGDMTYAFCKKYLDDIIVVSKDDICSATKDIFLDLYSISEPSGALSIAGAKQFAKDNPEDIQDKKILTVLSGANADPDAYASTLKRADSGSGLEKLIKYTIREAPGNLRTLLKKIKNVVPDTSITKFKYGKISEEYAQPAIGINGTEEQIKALESFLTDTKGIVWEDVTNNPHLAHGNFDFNKELIQNSLFYRVSFPERPGALDEFLEALNEKTDLTLFDYDYEGPEGSFGVIAFDTDDQERLEQTLSLYTDNWEPEENPYISREIKLPTHALS